MGRIVCINAKLLNYIYKGVTIYIYTYIIHSLYIYISIVCGPFGTATAKFHIS